MGAITFNPGPSPAQLHPRSCHRCFNVQHCSHVVCASVRATRNEEDSEKARVRDSTSLLGRRGLLVPFTAGAIPGVLKWNLLELGLALGLDPPSLAEESSSSPDYTITDKVYLDITKCPSISITSRENSTNLTDTQGGTSTLRTSTSDKPSLSTSKSSSLLSFPGGTSFASSSSSSSFYCSDGELLGRIVIGLYGKQVPETVANFKAMCSGKAGSSYKGSLFHRVLAGQYIMSGKQGFSKEKGEIPPPSKLDRNLESIRSEAFKMRHSRPGTVSLCLSENDDEDQIKLDPDYRNVEFLITTGPGPAPRLDNKNIVFGTVLEGLDVVLAAAAVPTYKPSERIRQFNELASLLGDERASNARSIWNRPLKALYISDCGEL